MQNHVFLLISKIESVEFEGKAQGYDSQLADKVLLKDDAQGKK